MIKAINNITDNKTNITTANVFSAANSNIPTQTFKTNRQTDAINLETKNVSNDKKKKIIKYSSIAAGIALTLFAFRKISLRILSRRPSRYRPTGANQPPQNPAMNINNGSTPPSPNDNGIISSGETSTKPKEISAITDVPKITDTLTETNKPKYLYHLTSLENYNSMMKDGFIKKSQPPIDNGVFLSRCEDIKKYPPNELSNMLNWYAGNINQYGFEPVSASHKVVLLKIPTKNLDENLINWRAIRLRSLDNNGISSNWNGFTDLDKDIYTTFTDKPLEFLYKKEIPMTTVQKCGEMRINNSDKNIVNNFWAEMKV